HTPTPQIYTLSLHDALPISYQNYSTPKKSNSSAIPPSEIAHSTNKPTAATMAKAAVSASRCGTTLATISTECSAATSESSLASKDRKSTRLNSSHDQISYAV